MEAKYCLLLVPAEHTGKKRLGSETLKTRGNAADMSPGAKGQEKHSCAVWGFTGPLEMSFLKSENLAGRW